MTEDIIKTHRSVIRRDIDELQKQLNRIEDKIDALSNKLDNHIDFIDETYKTLKTPLQLARKWFTMR
jgi:SMC interacting uncharacterized protein involved in chromosome segregation